MIEKIKTMTVTSENAVEKAKTNEFRNVLVTTCALACTNTASEDFDLDKAEQNTIDGLKALNAQGGLQEMLVSQMLSIHALQQQAAALARASKNPDNVRYYTNATIKLANCFAQQANTLCKL